MMDSENQAYQYALQLWKGKKLFEAETVLKKVWADTGRRSIYGTLLMGYILRDSQRYVSEIRWLQQMMTEFADAPERKVLAEAWSLLGTALRELGEGAGAVEALLHSAEVEPDLRQKIVECSNAIFAANAAPEYGAIEMQALYTEYRALLARLMKVGNAVPYDRPVWRHERIRVGYLSADFHAHPVGNFVHSLLVHYDVTQFEVYVYNIGRKHDRVTRALHDVHAVWRNAADWVDQGAYSRLAAQIRADEIDILVDLGGHTKGNALPVFAWQAAPVQISGIGYFNSTGLYETTGFLSDVYCAPAAQSPYFVEPLLQLPHTHFCYEPFADFPVPGEPPCLTKKYITFGCFNHFAKVTDEMLRLWRQILQALPTAQLVLKHRLFGSQEGLAYTKQRLARLGLPLERVEFRGFSADYLQEYHDIDIALDTSPYQGGATTCEALCMGVPVVSLAGERHGARFGVSFLTNIGLPELAAHTPENYLGIAVGLANDKELLCALHARLRTMMVESPLMDGRQYLMDMETMYRRLRK